MTKNQYAKFIENPNPREKVQDGERYFREKICSSKEFQGWTLYEQPVINSMHPDFILVHPRKAILIIEVKDWHLNYPQYEDTAKVLGTNGKYHTSNPVDQVRSYKDIILKYELDTYLEATEQYSDKAFAMITPIVYFHKVTRDRALRFCGNPSSTKCLIWARTDLDELCEGTNRNDQKYPPAFFYPQSNFAKNDDQSMQKLVNNLENILRPSDYARGRKYPFTLTSEQSKLVPIQQGSIRRWGGVAGSGKTVIIATKATEAIKKNHRVLLLTFNITLRHYIRDLCSQQFGDGNRKLLKSNLTIAHFHGFLKILMTELGIRLPKGEVEDYTADSMNEILNRIVEHHPDYLCFDSILIDEGQDFNGEWIRFLKSFYTFNGEILVMYDKEQIIYEDKGLWITNPNEIAGIGFRGQVGHLSVSHRLPNEIVKQIERLNPEFNFENKMTTISVQGDLFTEINWINIGHNVNVVDVIREKIDNIMSQGVSTIEDITVITMREDTGIMIVNGLEESKYKLSHVYDLSGARDYSNRRNEKWRFQPGKGRLKTSTYHSFKGWESSHIILILDGTTSSNSWNNMRNALYISLTRVNSFSESRSFTCINSNPEFNSLIKYFK